MLLNGNLTINGPMQGGLLQVNGTISSNVQIGGPINTNSAVPVGGSIGGSGSNTFTINGPFSGKMIVLGNINSTLSINGPMQSGRIAVDGSILGNMTVNGPIDGGSAVAVAGSIGNGHGTVLSSGDIQGIVASVGPVYLGKVGNTSKALFDGGSLGSSSASGQIIGDIFTTTKGGNPTFLATPSNFAAMETNLSLLSVNATSGNLQLSTTGAKPPHNALDELGPRLYAGPDSRRLRHQQPLAGRHRPDHRHRRCLRRSRHLPGGRCLRQPVRR